MFRDSSETKQYAKLAEEIEQNRIAAESTLN